MPRKYNVCINDTYLTLGTCIEKKKPDCLTCVASILVNNIFFHSPWLIYFWSNALIVSRFKISLYANVALEFRENFANESSVV